MIFGLTFGVCPLHFEQSRHEPYALLFCLDLDDEGAVGCWVRSGCHLQLKCDSSISNIPMVISSASARNHSSPYFMTYQVQLHISTSP